MNEYKPVKSTVEISRRIADFLERLAPERYNGASRPKTIRKVNDILQGRSVRTPENLLAALRNMCARDTQVVDSIRQDYLAHQEQVERLRTPYTKTSNQQYAYNRWDVSPDISLKVIDQALYDQAVKEGFPPAFFDSSYFDRVTIYCMPDQISFKGTVFHGCTFAACRICGVRVWDTLLRDCEFHSCSFRESLFADSLLTHIRFHDCKFRSASFLHSQLRHCHTRDSVVNQLDFSSSRLDNCSFGRMFLAPSRIIKGLDTAEITMGGATEECRRNRNAIFRALGIPGGKEQSRKPPAPTR